MESTESTSIEMNSNTKSQVCLGRQLSFTSSFTFPPPLLQLITSEQAEALLGTAKGSSISTANISWHGICASTKPEKKCFKVIKSTTILKSGMQLS